MKGYVTIKIPRWAWEIIKHLAYALAAVGILAVLARVAIAIK